MSELLNATTDHFAQLFANPIRQHDASLLGTVTSGPLLAATWATIMEGAELPPQAIANDENGLCIAAWGFTYEPLLAEAHLWLVVSQSAAPERSSSIPTHLTNSITEMHSTYPRIVAESEQGDFVRIKWLLDAGFKLLERPDDTPTPNLIFISESKTNG
jgi:hypothetical protein